MILLISDSFDHLTTEVELALNKKNIPWQRLNSDIELEYFFLKLSSKHLDISIKCEKKDLIKPLECVVWHRRGENFNFKTETNEFESFLFNERKKLFEGVISIIEKECNNIGRHFNLKDNRIYNAYLASRVGLNIPDSIVTTSKIELYSFKKINNEVITKPIGDIYRGKFNAQPVVGKVFEIKEPDLTAISDVFFPMLFQQKVQRDFEVRVFIFKELIYSIAIFIDNDSNVDYRYADSKNIRQVPYKLPMKVEEKCFNLLSRLELDSASFDFIVSPHGEHFFLELNPYGSIHRNSFIEYYQLPDKIVRYITQYENHEN